MKPTLHRSITFWSGILVMGFICWGWWDSTRHNSAVNWLGPGDVSKWRAANSEGAVFLERIQHRKGTRLEKWGAGKDHWHRYPMSADSRESQHDKLGDRLYAYSHDETPYDGIWIFDSWILSYRALILPPLAIWIALLLWRARRRRKVALLHPQ